MDALRDGESAVVEIYTRIYILNAGLSGKKIRTNAELNIALAALGSPPVQNCGGRRPITRPMHWSPRQGCSRIWPIRARSTRRT